MTNLGINIGLKKGFRRKFINILFCHFHDSCYLCQRIKTKRIMAKPIKETPVLTGDDATRFAQSAHEVVPASQKEKDDAKKAYSFFASIANFAL